MEDGVWSHGKLVSDCLIYRRQSICRMPRYKADTITDQLAKKKQKPRGIIDYLVWDDYFTISSGGR